MDLKMEVYTPGLELVGMLEVQRSVIWEEKAFSAGSFSVESLITGEARALLVPENIIWIEGQTAGIIEHIDQQAGKDGPYITVKGPNLTGILGRRILWGKYDLSGTVPAIMRRLVEDCCIHPTRGDAEARKIPNLVLAEDNPQDGSSVRAQKTGGTLLEALEELGEAYGVAFGVRFNPEIPRMEFWVRPSADRSVRQNVNEPVFYSTELDDVLSSEYTYHSSKYRNIALVAGEGEGANRVMITVEGEDEPEPTPPKPPEPVRYTVTLSVDPQGGGMASGGGSVEAGTQVTVTASASSGYTFSGWRENGTIVSTNQSYTFTVTEDRSLTAVFAVVIPTYRVTAEIAPEGSGTASGGGTYQQGASVTVMAAPADGYKFIKWTENEQTVSESESYTFTITGDRTLIAMFDDAIKLPDGYTLVQYVKNSNNFASNPIATVPINLLKLELDVDFVAFYRSYKYIVSSISGITVYMCMGCASGRYWYLSPGNASVTIKDTSISAGNLAHIILDVPKGKFSINDIDHVYAPSTISDSAISLTLGKYGDTQPMRLHSAKVFNNDEIVSHVVPCANASGQVILYDIVQNKEIPYSGTLTAGPAV